MEPEAGSLGALPIVNHHNEQPRYNGGGGGGVGRKFVSKEVREVEVRKAIIPLDERMTMFTALLKEKEVSSTIIKHLFAFHFFSHILYFSQNSQKIDGDLHK